MLKKIYTNRNNKKIDLSTLSLEELNLLNLYEEEYFAKEIKNRKKFSKERYEYMKNSYKKIFQIADWKRQKDKTMNEGNGVTDNTIKLLQDLITNYKKDKNKIVFFEAGVGTGYAIKQLLKHYNKNISINGCDIFISDEVKKIIKENKQIHIHENNLYDELNKIKDETIDIFYADNILEHIVDDEYEETCKLISKKIKHNGIALFIIPNSYMGPSDISRIRKNNKKATGFHFMEQTFNENIEIFKKYNLHLKYFYFRSFKKKIKFIYKLSKLNTTKLNLERTLGNINIKKIRNRLLKRIAYDVYILEKR